jgi:hypothetical protein
MTGAELEAARAVLGVAASDLGRALQLEGRDPGQQVRRWETGAARIPGPVAVAVAFMVELKTGVLRRKGSPPAARSPQAGADGSAAILAQPTGSAPVDPPAVCSEAVAWSPPGKARRRG